jgi:hypothetical protein
MSRRRRLPASAPMVAAVAFDGPALLVYPRGGGAPLRFVRK